MPSAASAALAALADRWWPELKSALALADRPTLNDDELRRRLRTMLQANAATFYRVRSDPPVVAPRYDQLSEQARKFYRRPGDEETVVVATDRLPRLAKLFGPTLHCRLHRATRCWRLWRPDALSTSTAPRESDEPCPLTSRVLRALDEALPEGRAYDGAAVRRLIPQSRRAQRAEATYLHYGASGDDGVASSATHLAVGSALSPQHRISVELEPWLSAFYAFDDGPWTFRCVTIDTLGRCLAAADQRRVFLTAAAETRPR